MIPRQNRHATGALALALLLLAGCQGAVRELENALQPDLHPAMSQEDVRLASGAMQQALEKKAHGEPVVWRNPRTGFSGAFTPARTFQTDKGRYCREFTEDLRSSRNEEARYRLAACRTDQGVWQVR